jgi:hypothetical protein
MKAASISVFLAGNLKTKQIKLISDMGNMRATSVLNNAYRSSEVDSSMNNTAQLFHCQESE